MSDKKRDDSTSQLIASAEALRKGTDKASAPPSTRKLIRQSERLLGRQGAGSGAVLRWILGGVLALLVAGAAYAMWLR